MSIALAVLIIGVTGLVCGAVLALAARFFAVHEDPRIEQVTGLLPGANCGGCGFAGCADYATAIVVSGAEVNLCLPGGKDMVAKVAGYMGVAAEARGRTVALVLCGGDDSRASRRFAYNGVADCAAASALGGGEKTCRYGCLGYGSCSRVCPVGAIEITEGRLAVVHPELCSGCGKCVKACPRRLIRRVPQEALIHVLCSSRDKGPAVKKACQVGCVACTLCAKLAANGAIRMDGALAVVDYTKPIETEDVIEKCPGHCIVKRPLSLS